MRLKKARRLCSAGPAVFAPAPPARATARAGTPAEPAAAAPAGLWQKALVNIHRQNRDWYPEKITILSEVLNRRGRPDSVTQFFFYLRLGAAGRLHAELARALKNGEDITLKMKKKVEIRGPRKREAPGQRGFT